MRQLGGVLTGVIALSNLYIQNKERGAVKK